MITRDSQPETPALSDSTPEQLALRAKDGSLAAYTRLVGLFEGRLYNFLLRRVSTPSDAEDLTQEALVRAWTHIDSYDARWRFSTWLFTIASRLAISKQRHDALSRPARESIGRTRSPFEQRDIGAEMDRREQFDELWSIAEETLSRPQLTALWLRYAEDCSIGEIATILRKSQVGVRVMLFRTRQTLLASMNKTRARPAPLAVQTKDPPSRFKPQMLVGEPS